MQSHVYDPFVFVQVALEWHLWELEHSSKSEMETTDSNFGKAKINLEICTVGKLPKSIIYFKMWIADWFQDVCLLYHSFQRSSDRDVHMLKI